MKQIIYLAAIMGFVSSCAVLDTITGNIEEPKYKVLPSQESNDSIEIRLYAPMITAGVNVKGDREGAAEAGFRLLADYIFGNNTSQDSIDMTAPVTQQSSEKIAMTAPVTMQAEKGNWSIRFVMPAQYSMETLPKPNNEKIIIEELPERTFAVIRFSGSMENENILEKQKELEQYLSQKDIEAISDPIYAFYNPPFTPPFLRRNEVMIEVDL